jgi:glycosyltransferase involved in cell wall biosynthesis
MFDVTEPRSCTPRISVCLLAYNHANIIRDAIRSVLDQDFQGYELILSDDCSTDETWAIIQAIAAENPGVRALRTPHNMGMAGNANFAVAHAKAPFIALLHHDDLCQPTLLRRWLEVIERHSDVSFVSNGYAVHGTDIKQVAAFAERNDGRELLESRLLPILGSPFRGTAMIRRTCWDAVGGMREQFGMLADVDLWMRLSARWAVGYVREPLIVVRHDRPSYYPQAYVGWSWPRMRLGYVLYGTNHREYYGVDGLRTQVHLLKFRLRVSRNIGYWLAYAVVKRRWDMLATSEQVANEFELPPVVWIRRGLAKATERIQHRRQHAG